MLLIHTKIEEKQINLAPAIGNSGGVSGFLGDVNY